MGQNGGMVQPSKAGPAESSLRAKALAAAAHILATRGVDDLSLRAIAENAGIGIASIYHYFANKDELLLQLGVMGFGELHEHILRYQSKAEFATPMQASARAYFDYAEAHPAMFSLMFNERLMQKYDALREAEFKTFLAYQAAVEVDKRFAPAHRANVAFALWALGRGIASIISSYPDGRVPPEIVTKLFAGAAYLINHPE